MIYGVFCEDIDFPNGSMPFLVTSTIGYDPTYSRCGVSPTSSSGTDARTRALIGRDFTDTDGVTSLWVHCHVANTTTGPATTLGLIVGATHVNAGSTGDGIYIRVGSVAESLQVTKRQSDIHTVLIDNITSVFTTGNKFILDLEIIDYGETGIVNLYKGGALIGSFTGDIRVTGLSSFNRLAQGGEGSGTSSRLCVTQCVAASTDTRGILGVMTRVPTGAGDSNDMTGDHTAINTVSNNDLTALYANTNNHAAHFALTPMPAGDYRIAARCVSVRAVRSTDATVTTMKLGEKITGGASNLGDAISVDAGVFKTYQRIIEAYQSKTDAGNTQVALQVLV